MSSWLYLTSTNQEGNTLKLLFNQMKILFPLNISIPFHPHLHLHLHLHLPLQHILSYLIVTTCLTHGIATTFCAAKSQLKLIPWTWMSIDACKHMGEARSMDQYWWVLREKDPSNSCYRILIIAYWITHGSVLMGVPRERS